MCARVYLCAFANETTDTVQRARESEASMKSIRMLLAADGQRRGATSVAMVQTSVWHSAQTAGKQAR